MRQHFPAATFLGVAGSFAAGAALVWLSADAAARRRLASPQPVSDSVLVEQVRSRVAELVSEPSAIEVGVEGGVVRLAGPVSYDERDALLTQLIHLPGVFRIRNALTAVPIPA